MESTDWDNVLQQYVSDPTGLDDLDELSTVKPVSQRTLQIPTPPISQDSSPADEDVPTDTVLSVSTTFYPGGNADTLPPDLILLSSDTVFFYVTSHKLLTASQNGFNSLLPVTASDDSTGAGPVLALPETSAVLNIVLHTIYDLTCVHYNPPFQTVGLAVGALLTYGVPLKTYVSPPRPLFQHLLSYGPSNPLELYILAASHDLYDLAVGVSPHLLSLPLPSITDEMAVNIGPVYLKRLFFLHLGRADALKRLLLPPPHPHTPTHMCDFQEQKKLTRAWALAAAYLAWDARPDLSTSTIEAALNPLGEQLACDLCRNTLKERIKNLVIQWSAVKRTI